MRVLTSMELDDEDKLDAAMPIPMSERPDYPYGLKMCLTEKDFARLKLDPSVAAVGGMIHGHFIGRITSVSADDREGGSTCRVEVQIEDLAIESEDDENEDD